MLSKCYYSCGQSTHLYVNTLKAKLDRNAVQIQEDIALMASYPFFNQGPLMNEILEPEGKLDEKVFSFKSIAASAKLLQHPKFLQFLNTMELHLPNKGTLTRSQEPVGDLRLTDGAFESTTESGRRRLVPTFGVDPDTLDKLLGKETDEFVELLTLQGFKDHVANIQTFRQAMRKIPEEATQSQEKMIQWQLQIKNESGESCFTRKFTEENALHYDHVLRNFGPSDITVKDLESFGMKNVQGFMQWFARSLNCWKLKNGAVSDVFNLLKLFLFNTEYKNSPVEDKVEFLLNNEFSLPKQVPVILKMFMDGERDDIYALALICMLQKEKVELVVQLPVLQEENTEKAMKEYNLTRDGVLQSLDNVKTFYNNLFHAGFVKSVQFIEDPESKNLKKVIKGFTPKVFFASQ